MKYLISCNYGYTKLNGVMAAPNNIPDSEFVVVDVKITEDWLRAYCKDKQVEAHHGIEDCIKTSHYDVKVTPLAVSRIED